MTLISQYKMEIRTPRKYPENIDPGQKKSAPGTFFSSSNVRHARLGLAQC